jgi:HK97 family phage major capsid protein
MTLEEIIARLEEIRSQVVTAEKPEDFQAEIDELEARKAELEDIETRKKNAEALQSGAATPEKKTTPITEGRKDMFAVDSKEYRTAWSKYMLDMPLTDEERTAFTHTTGTTSGQTAGYTIPTTLLNRIWDLIDEKHSILRDITIYRTGTILEVAKRTAIAAGDAGTVNEATAPANDENNTFAKVTLAGKDFAKVVKISYALGKMSIDGFEQFIATEIADRLGAALAADVIAQIGTDYYSTGNDLDVAASGKVAWTDVTGALAVLKNVNGISVYASNTTIYKYIVGMTDSTGRPLFQHDANEAVRGFLAGFPVKAEDAITDDLIWFGDPTQVVGNMVQDVMVENARDIEKHVDIYSGYARFQCALLAPKAFAKLDVTP